MYRLLIIFLIGIFFSCAQPHKLDNPENLIFQKVHEVKLDKNDIYERSLEWMAKTFVSSKSVIEYKDKEDGKIVGNASSEVMAGVFTLPVEFTMSIECKENKYRATFENFMVYYLDGDFKPTNRNRLIYKEHWDSLRLTLENLDHNLYEFLSNTKEDENW